VGIFELVFWGSLGMVAYAYFGYPVLLGLLSIGRNKEVSSAPIFPPVSLILTVFNEARVIKEKLRNISELQYPKELLQVIVVSDASTDGTDVIVQAFQHSGLTFIRRSERKGKEACQTEAVEAAKGEILIFTDASVFMPPDAVLNLVSNFADPSVGCVSSTDSTGSDATTSAGESLYVKYEMLLRDLESRVGSLVGLSGSCFAARRQLCHGFSEGVPSDFVVMLNAVRKGLRGVSDARVQAVYKTTTDPAKEFARKVRTVVRGMTGLWKNRDTLNPLRYGFFSIQLWSHKLFRWLVPFFLGVALIANGFLALNSGFYRILLTLHVAFYLLAVLGVLSKPVRQIGIIKAASFFVMVNVSIAVSWWRFIRGERILSWNPTRR
jgi:cellulose synthase/poly-beta-1,6-N-acetylglucosamine synthase-like glycosyltransferase